MKVNEKLDLLSRNIWTYNEVKNYLNISGQYNWRTFITKIKPSPFGRRLYRDDVLNAIGTTAQKEIELLREIEG